MHVIVLDHLTVIAPRLSEGVAHIRECLGIEVPFGTHHEYMGTHNHRLRLGEGVYLEIVALDPEGTDPGRARWFGLDDQERVRSDWDDGRRLRGWVAASRNIRALADAHPQVFGECVQLPADDPKFAFSIPVDGSLPLDGAAPSLIDRGAGSSGASEDIPDLQARLRSFVLKHPEPASIRSLYDTIGIDRPPEVVFGPQIRYRAIVETPEGIRELF